MISKAVKATCEKVPLPEAFSLPRKFGVSWGCLTQGAFYGVDAVVAEGGANGVHFRYVLPYDISLRRYLEKYEKRERREAGNDRLPQYFADALFELSEKYEVEIADAVYVNGVEVDSWLCRRPTAESCVRGITEFLKSPPRVALLRRCGQGGDQRLLLLTMRPAERPPPFLTPSSCVNSGGGFTTCIQAEGGLK
ncbi:hypothetical protein [Pyrobaculum aerophilum]|uniref:hypothetical protein n=1 Tax=Pyrobaculum aerophilum TaxID=13773 RepID=UPI002FD89BE4